MGLRRAMKDRQALPQPAARGMTCPTSSRAAVLRSSRRPRDAAEAVLRRCAMTRQELWKQPLDPAHTLTIVQGDLTQEPADAIVNAANAYLRHGGGLAAAIVRRGGRVIQEESDAWVRQHGPLRHDQAAVTSAGALPARYVIHVVGPRWGSGDEAAKLRAAVHAALRTAQALRVSSVALPAISTGIFGYPVEQAAEVILDAVADAVARGWIPQVREVRVVLLEPEVARAFVRAAQARFAAP